MQDSQPTGHRLGPIPMRGRKAVSGAQEQWVSTFALQENQTIPLGIRPQVDGLDLVAWASTNRTYIEGLLHHYGALLFRGFLVNSIETFAQFVQATAGDLYKYHERSSPRTEVGKNIYTSTDYPQEYKIFLHNEHSYARDVPLKIYFYCDLPAQAGGETPIADCRKVLLRIPEAVRERFRTKGWRYVRNFGEGFGLTWETAFQTTDKAEVERYCQENYITSSWKSNGCLHTEQVRPALAIHPRTGETVWFNHATFFHVSTLPSAIGQALQAEISAHELPNNTYYGDGTPIEPEVLQLLREAYIQEEMTFTWEKGDILMLDNMLTAHARNAFQGPRRVLVGMADIYRWFDGQTEMAR